MRSAGSQRIVLVAALTVSGLLASLAIAQWWNRGIGLALAAFSVAYGLGRLAMSVAARRSDES